MPTSKIAIFEGYSQGGYADGAPAPKAKKPRRKRTTSSPAQKRQQAKLKHCVRECKRSKPFRPCMSTCLRRSK